MKVNTPGKKHEFDTEAARQITEKIQQARRAGLEVVHYFTVIESASKGGRKIFNYMLDMALGFGVKNVIFKSTDRMSRNYNDLVRIENLMDKSGFQIHFYQSGTILNDKASSSDRFMLGIELAVAKHWSDKISQDVRQANKYKVKKGLAPQTLAPYGYFYDKKNRRHLKDPACEKNIQFIFQGGAEDKKARGGAASRPGGAVGLTLTADQASFIVEKFCKKFASAPLRSVYKF